MKRRSPWIYVLLFFLVALLDDCNPSTEGKATQTDTSATVIQKTYDKGSFGYDWELLRKYYPQTLLLSSPDSSMQVAISPVHQGRVMTSTAEGFGGQSFGWLNYPLLSSWKFLEHITPVGGEERFWMGPEGGQYSIYFKSGTKFEYTNWQVPKQFDSEPFELKSSSSTEAEFQKEIHLENYSKTKFDLRVDRTIRLLDKSKVESILGVQIPSAVKLVGFETENKLTNTGQKAWTKSTGLLSVWILSMLNASPQTTVVVPYKKQAQKVITDDYFGKVPAERLKVTDSVIYFVADSKARGKIGISPAGAKPFIGSYDAQSKVLTIAQFSLPGTNDYVNSQWKIQEKPYSGDAVNSYNDGPIADGTQMGQFYEIESSSPAAALAPGKDIVHFHRTFHFKGTEEELNTIAKKVLGVRIEDIRDAFKK
jgi:hypothetical protein